MEKYRDIAAVLPVREGSSRVKDKVILPFTRNLNLLEWKIDQLKEVLPHENIFVSTDSDKLKQIALDRGVSIHHRDPFLCKGHLAKFSDVITGVAEGIPLKHLAWITVVVPLMSPNDYRNGFDAYLNNVVEEKNNDSLVAVNLLKEYFWHNGKALNYTADENHTISQDLPDYYKVTNGLYMRPTEDIIKGKYFLGSNPHMFTVAKMAGIDIDEWEDYEFSLAMQKFYKESIIE